MWFLLVSASSGVSDVTWRRGLHHKPDRFYYLGHVGTSYGGAYRVQVQKGYKGHSKTCSSKTSLLAKGPVRFQVLKKIHFNKLGNHFLIQNIFQTVKKYDFLWQVPIVVSLVVLVLCLYLVVAPFLHGLRTEYAFAFSVLALGALLYFPFIYFRFSLPGSGKSDLFSLTWWAFLIEKFLLCTAS